MMAHRRLPALFMRGGTSNALVFHVKDLPAERGEWDALFLGAMGAPDPSASELQAKCPPTTGRAPPSALRAALLHAESGPHPAALRAWSAAS